MGVSPNYVTPSNPQQIIIGCLNFLAATKDPIYIHITLKTNMSPENWCLEDDISFWNDPISRDIRSFCRGDKKTSNIGEVSAPPFRKKKAKSKVNDRTWRFTSPSIQTAGGTFSGGIFFRRDKFFHLGKMFESTPIWRRIRISFSDGFGEKITRNLAKVIFFG